MADGPETIKAKADAKREDLRSAVRVWVTIVAAGFLFVGGAGVVGYLIGTGRPGEGKDAFLAILPIAAAIVTYWFASRKSDPYDMDGLSKVIEASKKTG